MSVYIYTLPKAGTYFLAKLLSNMGLNDTGKHIFRTFFLDTHKFSLEENAANPSISRVNKFFVPVVRQLKADDVTFGHFPLPLNPDVALLHMQYICSYRHPRKTLTAEFIDFRFRRNDIHWLTHDREPNDQKAFEKYLEHHGTTVHLRDFQNIVLYKSLMSNPLVGEAAKGRSLFVNFNNVLRDAGEVKGIADFLHIEMSIQEAQDIHSKTLAAETKTKAVDLQIDRDALWTERAHEIYDNSLFPHTISIARDHRLDV